MSATLFKQVTYPLDKLVEDIEIGEIGLPEIQRPFVWPNTKVRDLFDSMYKGFPVGYLLFWVNGTSDRYKHIGPDGKQKAARLLIVDGQQRLTSLYAVLKGIEVTRRGYSQERIRIAFRPKDNAFAVTDAAIGRDPEFIPDISVLWRPDTGQFRFVEGYLSHLRDHRCVSDDEERQIADAIHRLYSLKDYPFTAMEVSATASEEQAAEVFVRINSKGTSLNQANFILTLMSVFWDEGRAELESFCGRSRQPSTGAASPFNWFIQPDPDQLLRVSVGLGFRRARLQHVYSILRGKDLQTGDFSDERREKQFAVLKDAQHYALDLLHWHDFFKAVLRAGYLSASMITSQLGLLYAYIFFLIGKRDFGVDNFTLRNIVARWLFMTAVTSRYTGSPETQMEEDLAALREVNDAPGFVAVLDRIIADTFTEDYWKITLPNDLATSSARSPALSLTMPP